MSQPTQPVQPSQPNATPAPAAPTSLDSFLTAEALAKMLGVKKETVGRWIASGLPAIRLGRAVTVLHEPSVVAWLKAKEVSRVDQTETDSSDD